MSQIDRWKDAELAVFGANVQPVQLVAITSYTASTFPCSATAPGRCDLGRAGFRDLEQAFAQLGRVGSEVV